MPQGICRRNHPLEHQPLIYLVCPRDESKNCSPVVLQIVKQRSGEEEVLNIVLIRGSGGERNGQTNSRKPQVVVCGRTAWICLYANVIADSVLVRIFYVFIRYCSNKDFYV